MPFDPISLSVGVGLSIIQASLTARANRKKLKDFNFPEIDQTRKVPYVAGTVLLDAPQVVWWGDFHRSKVTTEFSAWLNWLAPVTAIIDQLPFGYRYYVGMEFALCLGEVNEIQQVIAAEKSIWTGSVSGGSFIVDAAGAWGKEGGMYAKCNFANGSLTQTRDAYMATQYADVPGHRGVCVLTWVGPSGAPGSGKIKYSGYVSRTSQLRPMKFKVLRTPNVLGTAFSVVNGNEANPAEIIYDCLTSNIVGMDVSTSQIDLASFRYAAAVLHTEGIGTDLEWDHTEPVDSVLQRLIELIDAAIYTTTEGLVTLKLIRADYDVADLLLLDESNVLEVVSYTVRTPEEAANEVRINYIDIDAGMVKATATWRSQSNRRIRGDKEPVTIDYPTGNKATATKLATRDGLELALPLKDLTIRVNREAYALAPGSVFKFSWAAYGLVEEVYRVITPNHGNLSDPTITLQCVLDRFTFGDALFGESTDNLWTSPIIDTSPVDTADSHAVVALATAPPGSPANGDAYFVIGTATGAFTGHEGSIGYYFGGAWTFTAQPDGTRIYDEATGRFYDITGGVPADANVGALAGDLSGQLPDITVVGIQGTPVDATPPTTGQALVFDGTKWAPADVAAGGTDVMEILPFLPRELPAKSTATSSGIDIFEVEVFL